MVGWPGGIWCFDVKGISFHFPFYVDTLDNSPLPLRPINESWMEKIVAFGPGEYAAYSGCCTAVK
jgi:hypothetical protein